LAPGKPTNPRKRSARRTPDPSEDARTDRTIDPSEDDNLRLVRPDGLSVRRRRHDHGWSPRALVAAIELASIHASGLRRTLTPNLLKAIEEQQEPIRYEQLLLLADGLGCDPVDLLAEGEF
jgi:ribosome-binding protein aMBF1 (putative translation factor)